MKKITQASGKLLSIFLLLTISVKAQLHSPPTCGENFTLDWTSAPSLPNEYNWLPAGSLSNTYTDVDTSGIDFTVTFTGDTGALGVWGGAQTPKIGTTAAGGAYEGMDLLTMGYAASGITCTINFSSPIFALSFDLYHVNATGVSGDKYTISAQTLTGDTIYPTFTNSVTPSYTTNDATGVVNANSGSTSGTDAIVGVNFLDNNYITSITFLWQDCLTCTPGNIHGSGLGNFSFCIPQTLDFDGANDFVNRSAFLGDKSEACMMSWVKLDDDFTGGEIMGQRNFRLFVDSSNRLKAFIKTEGSGGSSSVETPDSSAPKLLTKKWNHVAAIYDGSLGTVKLFLNGDKVWTCSTLNGSKINNTSSWNSDHDFEIGRNTEFDNNYFKGDIYECRVYKKALTDTQLHHQINQEIEDNGGNVRGVVLNRDIPGLLWSDLELYYKMEIVNTGVTPDASLSSVNGGLNNMRTYQERTAPMPYVTKSGGDGDWANENNWLYGNLWDITGAHPNCAIVKIEDNIETSTAHETLGLLIDTDSELEVKNDQGLTVTSYLKLDGKLDLVGESQLIQSSNSELDVASTGSLERDQQGKGDIYSYNFWSSPVGSINSSTINEASSIDEVLRDGTDANNPQNITWVGGYNGAPTIPITLSSYWIFTFDNQVEDYGSWQQVNQNQDIKVGLGYTMKGSGSGATSNSQNYTFVGKPNNGDINHALTAANTSLLGNPYPSALDADQFILDNIGVIEEDGDVISAGVTTGALYFWEHFATNNSHVLAEYHGGYATYNLSGATMAIPDPMVSSNGTASVLPQRYIPVSQGFFVEGGEGGTVKFNNGQRVFKKESGGESVFTKSNEVVSNSNVSPIRADINRLYFNASFSNGLQRQLLLAEKEGTTEGVDFGYDAKLLDVNPIDISWSLADDTYVIQTISEIKNELEIPLHVKSTSEGIANFSIEELQGIASEIEIYFLDKQTNVFSNLREGAVEFNLQTGTFSDRYAVVFKISEVLIVEEFDIPENNLVIFYNTSIQSIQVNNPKLFSIKNIRLYDMLGQEVFVSKKEYAKTYEVTIPVSVATGTYLVHFDYNDGAMITKKLIIK